MGTIFSHIDSTKLQQNETAFPPTDRATLKAFIRTGDSYKRRRKQTRKWNQIQVGIRRMSGMVKKLQRRGRAPQGVILYLEGLDCSGKSSTGGLICDALEASGYSVEMVQYNRPPTEEQQLRPWMERFRTPPVGTKEGKQSYSALVWDRGPAGDFVYGSLHELSDDERVSRYEEFIEFDSECRRQGIFFCKFLFIADRDSIAETLGKRLAHKRMARDLHTWLDANSSPHERAGLDEIDLHIDPSDFIAFNNYDQNLARFCEFARNTNVDDQVNPWLVVSTYKRHAARLALLSGFESQLSRFAKTLDRLPPPSTSRFTLPKEITFTRSPSPPSSMTSASRKPMPRGIVEAREHGISIKAVLLSLLLVFLAYSYANQSLNFNIQDVV